MANADKCRPPAKPAIPDPAGSRSPLRTHARIPASGDGKQYLADYALTADRTSDGCTSAASGAGGVLKSAADLTISSLISAAH